MAAKQEQYVILLHGLARTARSMKRLERALSLEGFGVVNLNYPSREQPVEVLAQSVIPKALKSCPPQAVIHFVTHSLGGILVRYYFCHHHESRLGRVVMLGPPNQGSEVVDRLAGVPGFAWYNGPAGLQLGTQSDSIPRMLGPCGFQLGVIAGSTSINPFLSLMIPGVNDGKVSVASTAVAGQMDHLVLAVNHTSMMNNPQVIRQAIYFLRHGCFERKG
ncbi:esterase/lipase family protein [Dongshaea marina]|uniref:esterase/lipase family protein n=1 Tax=Dongshaea marina TaxID=2047966 RepID=UPI0019002980|nr:hypothetical protein [Dongshaea marina]